MHPYHSEWHLNLLDLSLPDASLYSVDERLAQLLSSSQSVTVSCCGCIVS